MRRSISKRVVQKRLEEVLGLAQHIPLHGTQMLRTLNDTLKLLLEG